MEAFSSTLRTVDTCALQRAVNPERKQAARYKDVWASEGIVPLTLKFGYCVENCSFKSQLCFLREGIYYNDWLGGWVGPSAGLDVSEKS